MLRGLDNRQNSGYIYMYKDDGTHKDDDMTKLHRTLSTHIARHAKTADIAEAMISALDGLTVHPALLPLESLDSKVSSEELRSVAALGGLYAALTDRTNLRVTIAPKAVGLSDRYVCDVESVRRDRRRSVSVYVERLAYRLVCRISDIVAVRALDTRNWMKLES